MPKLITLGSGAVAAALMAGVFLLAAPAVAQDYPNRPITLIVPFPPGGSTTIVGRIVADKMSEVLGQSIVVDNRGGAGGTIGSRAVAKSAGDGYTILLGYTGTLAIGPSLYGNVGYDPRADFEPIGRIGTAPNTLVVHPSFPVHSVPELIAYAKANPGKVNFGSQGVGTTPHLTGELFARVTGTKLTHVPYRGTAQAVNDLIAGHLDLLFFQLDSVREQYQAKRAKMLAVTTPERVPAVPDVPTMDEAGVKGFRSDTWNALAAPPKTPAAIVAKLNAGINEVLRQPETAEHLRGMNMTPIGGTPDGIKAFIKDETERWGDVIRAANIRVE